MNKFRSISGFTLVEMLISMGILSVLILGFSSYMYYQTKTNKSQETQQSLNNLQKTVLNAAGQEDSMILSEKLTKP